LRELSLHVLDLIENSIRAGATTIAVTVTEDPEQDRLEIVVEDNGSGLNVPPEVALDPYFTTKNGKRTGLGLSLFAASSAQAGGSLVLGKSELGGLCVKAVMQLSHIDRRPMGDLAATLSSVVCTNPDLDLRCRINSKQGCCAVCVSEVMKEVCAPDRCGLAVARQVSERLKAGLRVLSA
jgi:anti-sigma regulatory factor (Ser/Thr protein kinase)